MSLFAPNKVIAFSSDKMLRFQDRMLPFILEGVAGSHLLPGQKEHNPPSPGSGNEYQKNTADLCDPDLVRPREYDDEQAIVPSHTTKRRLMTKIDLRLIPCLSILYLFAFLDR